MRNTTATVAAALLVPALLGACERRPEPTPPAPPATPTVSPDAAAPDSAVPVAPMASAPAAVEGRIAAPGVSWEIPGAWEQIPTGGLRVAQLRAPGWTEERPNEVVLFYFGPNGAGGAEANLARWGGMMLDADGQPDAPDVGSMEVDGLRVTLARFEGTYLDGPPGQQKTPRENYVLLAAIYEGGAHGPAFLRFTGPRDVVDGVASAWREMLESARREAE